MDIEGIFKTFNQKYGEMNTSQEYKKSELVDKEIYGISSKYGPGLYPTTKYGLIKRHSIKEKGDDGKNTGELILCDKRICPVVLYPSKRVFVSGKHEMELTDGKISRMLTDETFTSARTYKIFLQLFGRQYWLDCDNNDVTDIHKLVVKLSKELKIEVEKVNNQFGWNDGKFSPYDIPVYIDDPVLKELETAFTKKGDRNKWLESIDVYRDNIIFETLFLTSLSSPLLPILNLPPVWVHLSGKSSTCKTAAMIAVSSIYGCPIDDGRNLITSFNTTPVGLENRLHLFNNLPVYLNDSQNLASYIRVDELIYLHFEGKGRNRGRQNEISRLVKRWQNNTISNGEKGLLTKNCYEGAAKRCIQIEGKAMELEEGKKVRRKFYDNYGHIGPEWIDIIKKMDTGYAYKILDKIYDQLKDMNNLDDNIQQVSGMCLSQFYFDTKINKRDKKESFKKCIKTGRDILSLIEVNTESADLCNKIMAYLKDFVGQNMSRFKDTDDELKFERYGFITKDENVCFYNNKLDDILIKEFNYDVKLFRKEIKERNLVILDSKKNFKQVKHENTNGRYPQFKKEVIFGIDIEEEKEEIETDLPIPEPSNTKWFWAAKVTRDFDIINTTQIEIDLNEKNPNKINGYIFLDNNKDYTVIKPDFVDEKVYHCMLNNLNSFGLDIKVGEKLFDQSIKFKQRKLGDE